MRLWRFVFFVCMCIWCGNSFADCDPGNYMESGECVSCPAGSYCSGDGTVSICPKGYFSEKGAVSCVSCPTGYTTDSSGATSGTLCKKVKVKLGFGGVTGDYYADYDYYPAYADSGADRPKNTVNRDDGFSFPECLTAGRVNTSVVKNKEINVKDD